MKTLGQIVEEVGDGGKPDYDDLRYAVVALGALRGFDQRALMKLAEGKRESKKPILSYDAERQVNESFNRAKNAFAKPPKEWVGTEHDPDNPSCQRFRALSKRILAKVTNNESKQPTS